MPDQSPLEKLALNPSAILAGDRISVRVRPLTAREQQVLTLIGQGYGGRDIAAGLGIAYGTLRKHRTSIIAKLDVRTSAQLAAVAVAMTRTDRNADLDLTMAGHDSADVSVKWRFSLSKGLAARRLLASLTSVH